VAFYEDLLQQAASGDMTPSGGVAIEHKKGEVNELKASLRNPAIDRDPEKKREVIKRVIAYMTLGIDVSKLFSEMIMVRPACRLRIVHLATCPVLTGGRYQGPRRQEDGLPVHLHLRTSAP